MKTEPVIHYYFMKVTIKSWMFIGSHGPRILWITPTKGFTLIRFQL